MPRGRTTRSIVSRPRKAINWSWAGQFGGVTGSPVIVPAASKVLLGFFVLSTAFDETVTRIRGQLTIASDQGVAAEEQVGAFGFVRVTDRARAAGVASIPGPVTDIDDDGWLLWQPFLQQTSVAEAVIGRNYQIDSKAQRIIREGEEVAIVVENAHDTFGLTIMWGLRLLSRFRS